MYAFSVKITNTYPHFLSFLKSSISCLCSSPSHVYALLVQHSLKARAGLPGRKTVHCGSGSGYPKVSCLNSLSYIFILFMHALFSKPLLVVFCPPYLFPIYLLVIQSSLGFLFCDCIYLSSIPYGDNFHTFSRYCLTFVSKASCHLW